jgi:thiamine kinase-like enzyme
MPDFLQRAAGQIFVASTQKKRLSMILSRNSHMSEVFAFLCENFPGKEWKISLPQHGSGQESFFAETDELAFFVKLGVQVERYRVMFELGLSPRLVTTGSLADGTNLIIQERVIGRHPSRTDFHSHLAQFAQAIGKIHRCEKLKAVLPQKSSAHYRDAGLDTLSHIEDRWVFYKPLVSPSCAVFVDESLGYLKKQIGQFQGAGLAASHNDVCNGNWLVSSDGRVYSIDYEDMSLGDPALDIGAILWWYYPPRLRPEFLEIAGYGNEVGFRERMRIRMAVHCLNIILPRENSFDYFDAGDFDNSLDDFRAALAGMENPQGYVE